MAVIAFAIVRLWNVWDAARSILLIVMLLFVEMALSADRPLMEESWRAGFAGREGVTIRRSSY